MRIYADLAELCRSARAYRRSYPDATLEFWENGSHAGWSPKGTADLHLVRKDAAIPTSHGSAEISEFMATLYTAMGLHEEVRRRWPTRPGRTAWERLSEPEV